MATESNIEKARGLVALGLPVFPVIVRQQDDNPYKTTKKPITENGFYDATLDPYLIDDLWEKQPYAKVGVWTGEGGIVVADIDVKRTPEGEIEVDGFTNFEEAWLDLRDTFSYDSVSGAGGRQYIYAAPEGLNLGPAGGYRGIAGVDRRGGGSYVVWNGPVPKSRDEFAPAPEWLLDEATVRSAAKFEGTVKDWYESLEPGAPNVLVRAAIERAEKRFASGGNDYDHAALVELQFNAVRLGAEGNPGVPELLARIEDLFQNRTGSHSRTEEEWAHEFQEALASGIEKHGAAIDLRKSLPEYSLNAVPASVPNRLVVGEPGNKEDFSALLRALQAATDDDLLVTSVLWNSPRTRDVAREWGLSFVNERVLAARSKPEPTRENPTLAVPEPDKVVKSADEGNVVKTGKKTATFLSASEVERIRGVETFIDKYVAASASKGFCNETYAVPSAWTALSMGFGTSAYIPKGVNIGTNLWFIALGYSGTGKSAEDDFLTDTLDVMLKDGLGYYNLGAHSSPEGLHEALLERDGQASMIHHDEASDFFEAVRTKDWMRSLKDLFAKWYVGRVDPMQKVRLKELRGKSARTSFNIHMLGTPDRLLSFIDTGMFESGFMARMNWTWAEPPADSDDKYRATLSETSEKLVHPAVFDLAADVMHARGALGTERVALDASPEAMERLIQAYTHFDKTAKSHEKYVVLEPAITRLGRETIWKCAALLALYEGRSTIELDDVLIAIHYATDWYWTLYRVVEATSESEFSGDINLIENWIKSQGGSVSEAQVNHRFRSMIRYGPRELQDRLDFLIKSGRLNIERQDSRIKYVLNGTAE